MGKHYHLLIESSDADIYSIKTIHYETLYALVLDSLSQLYKLNIKIKVWRMKVISPKNLFMKSKTINIIDDLKKT